MLVCSEETTKMEICNVCVHLLLYVLYFNHKHTSTFTDAALFSNNNTCVELLINFIIQIIIHACIFNVIFSINAMCELTNDSFGKILLVT